MKTFTLKLNPTSPTLQGKYPQGQLVMVFCNADTASFTINLPDCGSVIDTEFRLIREDENRDNLVTVLPFGTQKINNETEQTLRVSSVIDLTTDRLNWW